MLQPFLNLLRAFVWEERAQDTFEYALVIALVVVVLMAGLIAGFPPVAQAVLGLACPSVDTADPGVGIGTCIGP
jgi:hypothetical protein